tara:strand:- start:1758 stop:2978 length:1221 start_codon:yes stop_codon:yes gene_type:complete
MNDKQQGESIIGSIKNRRVITSDSESSDASVIDRDMLRVCAVLAHKLRNSLSVIQAYTDLMNPETETELQLQHSLRTQVERMIYLINDLLIMPRNTYGKAQLYRQPVDLKEIIDSVLQRMSSMFTANRQSLELKIDDQPCWLNGDRHRLSQVLINLLSNASKCSPKDSQICLCVTRLFDLIEIQVIDNEIGIEPDSFSEIFDFFDHCTTPDSLKYREGGLDIELGVVKRLVEMHDGWIEAFSDGLDTGSKFSVLLPACEPTDFTLDKSLDGDMQSSRSFRVLVVDDRRENEFIIKALVKKLGEHETRSACDGASALDVIKNFTPDIILLDLSLPDMTGMELAREIRKIEACRDTFLVALAGYGDDDMQQDTTAPGIDLYRTKPVSFDLIKDIFRQPTLAMREFVTE